MNTIHASIIVLIGAVTTAFAGEPQFKIEARYEGFDPSLFADVAPGAGSKQGILATPKAVARAGQTAVIEVGREVALPMTLDGSAPAPSS